MNKAEKLVNEAEKTAIGIPIDISGLIARLMKDEGITMRGEAANQIALAIQAFRRKRAETVSEKVLKAIINETGKPKNLEFTDRD
jgi:hypothetical protein